MEVRQEEELVLIRTEHNGIPTYIITSLVEVSEYGGSNANFIVTGMSDIFENQNSKFYMEKADCEKKAISWAHDGTSANFRY